MAYVGSQIPIPLGQIGLRTDETTTNLPPNSLLKANNVSFYSGRIEKSLGSTKYNATSLPEPIVSVFDWFPTPSLQRLIAVTEDGFIYRDTGTGTFNSNTPLNGSSYGTFSTDTHIVAAGAEEAGQSRKLFILSGVAQIKVLVGDSTTPNDIANPSSDWSSGNYPTYGIVYQNRLCVMGSSADRHRLYFSAPTNHQNFTGASHITFSIFPGEGDGILSAYVHRGLLFIFKAPFGVYVLDGRDPSVSNWQTYRYSDAFGVSSPHAVIQALGDLIAANSFGSFTSLQASDTFGDFEAGDILSILQVENYIRTQMNPAGLRFSHSVYYPEKKIAYFTGQSGSTTERDTMLAIDMARQPSRVSLETKDRPNCLALRKDASGILRPMYGTSDGFVFIMDQNRYDVGGLAYVGEFQTNYTDFSFASGELAGKNKIFDFMEVSYLATGNNDFFCDVFVDGTLKQTLKFSQVLGAELGSFLLDTDKLAGPPIPARNRKALYSCYGNKISFRFYNNTVGEGFKIERVIVSMRVGNEAVYASQI